MIGGGFIRGLGSRLARLSGRRQVTTGLAFALTASVLVVAAVSADGSSATSVSLDDGAVWVTNNQSQRVGRLVIRIDQLDLAVASGAAGDVLQEGRNVVYSSSAGGVAKIDVLTGESSGKNEIPMVQYQMNGNIGLLLDDATGALWVGSALSLVGSEYPEKPDAIVEEGSFAIVTDGSPERLDAAGQEVGRVVIVDRRGWYELALDESLKPVRADVDPGAETTTTAASEDEGEIEEPPPPPIKAPEYQPLGVSYEEIVSMSSVGDALLLLLDEGRVAWADGPPVSVPGDNVVLQQPGPTADTALVASTEGLFTLDAETGELGQIADGGGVAAAPVRVGSCIFGAWSGDTPTAYKECSGLVLRDGTPIPNAEPNVELVYRVNQKNVALNSPGNGGVWADHEGDLAYVGNWADVEDTSPESEEITDATGASLQFTERTCLEGGSAQPVAGDDELGARPRQSILDVLTNDDDANCEPIAITSVEPAGGPWGQLTIIDNGQHLLFSPSDEMLVAAAESIEVVHFQYTVEDSSGNESAPASVTLSVKDRTLGNAPPELRPKNDGSTREMRAVVEEGRSVSYNVLADWWDPDGDDLRLASVIAEGIGDASGSSDGVVRFSANGVTPGVTRVAVTMSDGELEITETLEVTVKPTGSVLAPVTSPDFLTLVEGASGVVSPLANDSDPNEDTLAMRPLWPTDGTTGFRTQVVGDAIEVTALEAGTYLLSYEATDGIEATEGAIRLVVRKPSDDNAAPIAVPDTVHLRVDRVVNVDVLANDVDLDGDILAVISVESASADDAPGLVRASIVDRRLVQIEVVPDGSGETPTGPFWVTYSVTDGRDAERAEQQSVEQSIADSVRSFGTITVMIQPPSADQPPVVNRDEAIVRSGDIVRVPVLRNDVDPDSDPIVLESVDEDTAAEMESAGVGIVWVEDQYVYFQAGEPGRASILYTVSAGNRQATGEVSFEIKDLPGVDTNVNQAPSPPDLVLRAVRDSSVRLNISQYGADADGDSVVLLDEFTNLQGAATGNRATVDPDDSQAVLFKAGTNSGPWDQFTYTVEDPFGERGSGTVTVLVLDDAGWPPQAHDDVFLGRPGRTMSIPLLANDSSPSDRALELAELPFFDSDGQPTADPQNQDSVKLLDQSVTEQQGRVEIIVPADGTTLTEHYRITDGRNPSDAFLRVTPDPDAPNLPPVANPDVVKAADVVGQEVADVEVLLNDFDPDDADARFDIEIPGNQDATVSGGVVSVTLHQRARTVLYRITDADGAKAVGIITVPGRENHPPVLSDAGRNPRLRLIKAGDGGSLDIKLDDIVEDPDGDPLIELTDTEVKVLGSLGSVRRFDDGLGFTFTPPANLQFGETIAIQFEVTDRPNMSLVERQQPGCNCTSLLTVEVTIEASSPPRILSDGAVPVPQLDEEVSFDLADLVIDDQGDPLTYELDPGTFGGLEVQLNGSVVSLVSRLAEDERLQLGMTFPIRFTVTDGNFPEVEGRLNASIIATNKGQPAAGVIPQQEAERDFDYTLPNLIQPAVNPFEGRPLKLIDSWVDGIANVTCNLEGDCTFLSDSVGSFTVNYVLEDAVGQLASGSLVVVVKGKPRAPGVPSIVSVGDHQVNLSWAAADMQGGEFIRYHVTAVESGDTMYFETTGGVFDGLINGQSYTFTVLAENELGIGEVSAPSTGAIPDRVPDPPVNARIVDYQDSQLTLQWDPPPTAGDFTAITHYEIAIGGQYLTVDGSTTTLVVGAGGMGDPLQNGTDYTFTVHARNSATVNNGWGDWSAESGSERPSRYPDPVTGVSAVNSGDGGTPRLTVTWNAPGFDGGRAVTSYEVCMSGGSCQDIPSGTTATFDASRSQSATFTVIAINTDKNRNDSDPTTSAPVVAVGDPDTPVISSVTSGNHQIVATASTTNNSGCSAVSVEYSINDGSSWQGSGTFTGLTNGTQYSVVTRAILAPTCGTPGVTYLSPTSAPTSQTPYGPLVQPTMNVSVSGTTITWTWSANRADDGRPDWNASLSGECAGDTVPNGTYSYNYGYSSGNRTCTITVSAGGVPSLSDSATASTPPPPPPPRSISISWATWLGNSPPPAGCSSGTCYTANVTFTNFSPGTYTYYCQSTSTGSWATYWTDTVSIPDSSHTIETACYHSNVSWSFRIRSDGINSNAL